MTYHESYNNQRQVDSRTNAKAKMLKKGHLVQLAAVGSSAGHRDSRLVQQGGRNAATACVVSLGAAVGLV